MLKIWNRSDIPKYGHSTDVSNSNFESGRRCESGPGVFIFRCPRAEELFYVLHSSVREARASVEEQLGRISAPPPLMVSKLSSCLYHLSACDLRSFMMRAKGGITALCFSSIRQKIFFIFDLVPEYKEIKIDRTGCSKWLLLRKIPRPMRRLTLRCVVQKFCREVQIWSFYCILST
ncbi:unnamed protein product [Soboliphyme baturini]|uniref:IRS-type PTB domain-containing protein n=1 Tax=Soboliphyme baturini TaxID=241478 RepID=A0A183J5C3_9BILA|nr:unnamed protein product [Soboliphyme baturini]